MHFLHSHMLHYTSPVSTYSCGVQMVPNPGATASSDWQPHVPLNIATGLLRHPEAISNPSRNVWGCSGMPSQGNPTLQHSSSNMSSCLHMCHSDREETTVPRLQSQCGSFQPSRTTPTSPYMTQFHAQRGPSLLGLSSAFSSYPVICQAPQVPYSTTVPTMSNSRPICSPVYTVRSHPSLSVQTSPDPTQNHPNCQTPIHSSVTPSGQPQFHTAFSSLTPSAGHCTSMCTGQSQGQQGPVSGPRQNDLIGSSPIRRTQNNTFSRLGPETDRECRASLFQERTDNIESQSTTSSTPTIDIQPPHLSKQGIQTPH